MCGWLASFQNNAYIVDVYTYLQSSSLICNLCHRIDTFPADDFFVLHRIEMQKMQRAINTAILRVFYVSDMIHALLDN